MFYKFNYNIAFINFEGSLAKSRVDVTLCHHGKFPIVLCLPNFSFFQIRSISQIRQPYLHVKSFDLPMANYSSLPIHHEIVQVKRLCFYSY